MEKILELEGYADDLLMVDENNEIKSTRLFKADGDIDVSNEVIDISVTSTNIYRSHPIFDKILGKKIKLTLETID